METKICKICGIEKPIERFGKCDKNKDGFNGTCKDCTTKKSNERYRNIRYGIHVKKEKYTVDSNYFNEIDSEEKAYWLGFLYADGYVRLRHKGGHLKLKLCTKDKCHIELFKQHIKSNQLIKDDVELFKKDGKEYKSFASTLNIYNLNLVNCLIKHGCVQNKTQKIRFPEIDESLKYHFIRGYFDGDGCIHKRKIYENLFCITIVSNNNFCRDLLNILKMGKLKDFNNYSILKIEKIEDVKIFRDLIYSDGKTYLKRKKDIFDEIIDDYKYDHNKRSFKNKFLITTPKGEEIIVDNLNKFSKNNNLKQYTFYNLLSKKNIVNKDGWKCVKLQ